MTQPPGTRVPTINGTGVPLTDIPTGELLALDDTALHARLTEIRDAHQSYVDFINKWLTVIRTRALEGQSQEGAAKELKVSRGTVRKAAAKKPRPVA